MSTMIYQYAFSDVLLPRTSAVLVAYLATYRTYHYHELASLVLWDLIS